MSRNRTQHPDLTDDKFDAIFQTDPECVLHIFNREDRGRGIRKLAFVEKWTGQNYLGRGSFGRVHLEELCEDPNPEPTYRAVKFLFKVDMARSKIDFKVELAALTKFSKPKYTMYFVQFLGWYENEEHIFIAMEYIQHGTLDMYINADLSEDA